MSKRTKPLQLQDFQKLLDDDGRLVDESILRKTVFLGILIYYQVFNPTLFSKIVLIDILPFSNNHFV